MTRAGLSPTHPVTAVDEYGNIRELQVAGERPLTLYVDKKEIVTLMTLGTQPEALALGYLRNQDLIERIEDVKSVQVDWDTESVAVTTRSGVAELLARTARRTVTSGCGQGTMFGNLMERLEQVRLPRVQLRQSLIYELLRALGDYNEIYRSAGAVHGCALCRGTDVLMFVEDVGRHNAADAIAGHMWLEGLDGSDKIFYTTGRLTSEMVIKVAQMGIPVLLSRSGVTHMGLELARRLGVVMIARAKGRHFLVYNGAGQIVFDARPPAVPGAAGERRVEPA
ncbi:MAG TPA: formate dehydrogenase accessory sulfurtransferase FdhD [Burkholderiales bacterium]